MGIEKKGHIHIDLIQNAYLAITGREYEVYG